LKKNIHLNKGKGGRRSIHPLEAVSAAQGAWDRRRDREVPKNNLRAKLRQARKIGGGETVPRSKTLETPQNRGVGRKQRRYSILAVQKKR